MVRSALLLAVVLATANTYPIPQANGSRITRAVSKGCHYDGRFRILRGRYLISGRMTVHYCLAYCERNQFKYAGLENGNKCNCGNKMMRTDLRNDSECQARCPGDGRFECGGDSRLLVYELSE